jgi:hypothetical protein
MLGVGEGGTGTEGGRTKMQLSIKISAAHREWHKEMGIKKRSRDRKEKEPSARIFYD